MADALDSVKPRATEDDWADRYVLCEHLVDPGAAPPRQRFESLSRFVRDLIARSAGSRRGACASASTRSGSTTCRWSI